MRVDNTLQALLRMRVTSEDRARTGVTVAGELDVATVGLLRAWFTDTVLSRRPAAVTFDLSGLSFIDVAGVRALYQLHDIAAADGCVLTIVAAHRTLRWTLSRMGLDPDFAATPG